jgi:hypothetical protein
MASIPAPILVDRADVHKSCKSLEAIVYILANYTEAANAMAAVQKKLAKALKEAASVKGTNNVPGEQLVPLMYVQLLRKVTLLSKCHGDQRWDI